MAARVDYTEVQAILDTDVDSGDITTFIDDANTWVDANVEPKGELSDGELKAVERYLAAHFVTLRDPRIRQQRVGDVSETFQRDTQTTEYLKTAASFDRTGTVAAMLMGKPKVRFRVGEGFDDDLDLPETQS